MYKKTIFGIDMFGALSPDNFFIVIILPAFSSFMVYIACGFSQDNLNQLVGIVVTRDAVILLIYYVSSVLAKGVEVSCIVMTVPSMSIPKLAFSNIISPFVCLRKYVCWVVNCIECFYF